MTRKVTIFRFMAKAIEVEFFGWHYLIISLVVVRGWVDRIFELAGL